MTYEQAKAYIHSTLKFGMKPGLERIKLLLSLLCDPQDKIKTVHIAGTNGKGSTSAMTARVLSEAGYKTGLYISPYILNFRERISIDGEWIEKDELSCHIERVAAAVEKLKAFGLDHPTEFEIITACAFDYFAAKGCDVAVIEVGLGGRFDATNVLKSPSVTAITAISLDHTAILGDTVAQIAFEKCGIMKKERPVVVYPLQDDSVFEVISNRAAQENSKIIIPDIGAVTPLGGDISGTEFLYKNMKLHLSLLGKHQIYNCITAVEILLELKNQGFNLNCEIIARGIRNTRFAGRFDILGNEPLVIADGGHNRAGINALSDAVTQYLKAKRIITVMGMMRDKEHEYCINKMAQLCDVFIAVTPLNERSLTAVECASEAKACPHVKIIDDPKDGIRYALSIANKDDAVLVCGSLYLIGELYHLINNDKTENS